MFKETQIHLHKFPQHFSKLLVWSMFALRPLEQFFLSNYFLEHFQNKVFDWILVKVHLFIKEFLSKTAIFDKTSRYLITNSELFDGDIHFLFSNTTKFVKYLEVLSNITVFDRNSLMKSCTFKVLPIVHSVFWFANFYGTT